MKTWIIGVEKKSIGETLKEIYPIEPHDVVVGSTIDDVDVRDWDNIDLWCEKFGPFDAVVYVAGVNRPNHIHSLDKLDVIDLFDVNVFGFMGLMQSLTITQERCNVVAIVSDAGRIPMRQSIEYCSSKAALEMAVRVAARELAPGFRINGVSPGPVEDTGMTSDVQDAMRRIRGWDQYDMHVNTISSMPIGRWITKEEVADTVLHVLAGPAAQTGTIVDVTGGR